MDIADIAKRYTKPTEDQQQELANAARLWLRLIDEGQIVPYFKAENGITPGYIRQRLNDLEKALKPFPDDCCISDIPA